MKTNKLENGEGIVLSARQAGEGGRSVRLFTRAAGRLAFFAPKSALRRCGAGLLAPFARLRYTARAEERGRVLTQYEGKLLLDLRRFSYEDIVRWYYAVEIAERFFPEGAPDTRTFAFLEAGARGAARNPAVAAFILSVQLLALAGCDPAADEPMEALALSPDARALLAAFRAWRWEGDFPLRIGKAAFREAADYLDRFIPRYGDVAMKTRGAFLL